MESARPENAQHLGRDPITGPHRVSRRALVIGGAAALAAGGGAALVLGRPRRSPVLWTFETPSLLPSGPLVTQGIVLATSSQTYALDLSSGKVRWHSGTHLDRNARPAAQDGKCFVYDGTSLNALDAATGRRLWSKPIEPSTVTHVPTVRNGVVAMPRSRADGSYTLRALDATSGRRRWEHELDSRARDPAAAVDGTFYIASTYRLYAVDAATGKLRWRQAAGGSIASSPIVSGGLVIVNLSDYDVRAFDATTGQPRWQAGIGVTNEPIVRPGATNGLPVPPAPTVVGGTVFAATPDALHALNARDGRARWRFQLRTVWPENRVAVVATEQLAILGGGAALTGLDMTTGKARWRHVTGTLHEHPVLMNGVVYLTDTNKVLGFDPATGNVRVRIDDPDLPAGTTQNPFMPSNLVGADGTLYCNVNVKAIYALRPKPQ